MTDRSFFDIPSDERQRILGRSWEDGSLNFWIGGFRKVFFDEEVNAEFSEFVRERIRERVKDPVVAEKLTPRDHGFGTRRVPLETGYYEAFNRDNVELVDTAPNRSRASQRAASRPPPTSTRWTF